MNNIKGCLLHKSDEWKTPSWLFDIFMSHGYVDLFPFGSDDNQFDKRYEGKKLFCNPPFSKLNITVDYLLGLANVNHICLLMPSRTDTNYFYKLVNSLPCVIIFVKGRLHFNDSKDVAPFPTMLVFFGKNIEYCSYLCCDQKELWLYV